MNKHSFFTSIVTSLAVGLVCVMSAFTQTKRVPVIVMNPSSVFFQAIIKGAQDAASQAHGVTVIPIGSTQEGDLAGAFRALEDAVSQKPVTVTPADPYAFGPPIDSIPKGIVVVTADTGPRPFRNSRCWYGCLTRFLESKRTQKPRRRARASFKNSSSKSV